MFPCIEILEHESINVLLCSWYIHCSVMTLIICPDWFVSLAQTIYNWIILPQSCDHTYTLTLWDIWSCWWIIYGHSYAWICLCIYEQIDCWSYCYTIAAMVLDHTYACHVFLDLIACCCLLHCHCHYPCYCHHLNLVICMLIHRVATAKASFIIWPYTCLLSRDLA